jgi:aconitate hydratase 2/2-methylisocitrate dehydratase
MRRRRGAGLKTTLLMFDYFHDVKDLADQGNANAKAVLQSWADAEWFTSRPEVPASLTLTIFKVTGETNTDDLSPAPEPGRARISRCMPWPC